MNDNVFIGTIILWPIPWIPKGWALCNGSLLPITSNEALYSLIGTYYGGNGRSNFALPNFGGYISVGAGSKEGRIYPLGQASGFYSSTIYLNANTMPAHTHSMMGTCIIPETTFPISFRASANEGNRNIPQANDALSATTSVSGRSVNLYGSSLNTQASLLGITVAQNAFQVNLSGKTGITGASQPIYIDNMQRSIVMNYIIAVEGLYPIRPS